MSACGFSENRCSGSHSVLKGVIGIFPFFLHFYLMCDVEDFGVRDVHIVLLNICEFRENRRRAAILYLGL